MGAVRLNPEYATFVHKKYELTDFTVQFVEQGGKCTLVFNNKYSIDFNPSGTVEMYKNTNGTWSRAWSK